jgi:hypothetical protein
MAWWKVYDTDDVIGDGPLQALGEAVLTVVAGYQAELGRPPTRGEWEHLLLASLGGMQASGTPVLADGVLTEVRLLVERPAEKGPPPGRQGGRP